MHRIPANYRCYPPGCRADISQRGKERKRLSLQGEKEEKRLSLQREKEERRLSLQREREKEIINGK